MTALGYADDDKLPLAGGTMTGPIELAGVPAAKIPETGSSACMGTATLNGTTAVSVATEAVDASTRIFVSIQAPAGTVGSPYVASITPGTGFTVKSTAAGDTSMVAWLLIDHT